MNNKSDINIEVSTYSASSALTTQWSIDRFNEGKIIKTLGFSVNSLTNNKERWNSFLEEIGGEKIVKSAVYFEGYSIVEFKDKDLILTMEEFSDIVKVAFLGDIEAGEYYKKIFLKHFVLNENIKVNWYYSKDDCAVVTLKSTDLSTIDSYPHIKEQGYNSLEEYFDAFLESDSNILFMIGEPGTGKSNLTRTLINYSKSSAFISYDHDLLYKDSIFARFMEDKDAKFFIIEDADVLLGDREKTGNTVMHKFLNIGSGVFSSNNKKLILTTNLDNEDKIDPALLRPGRCFDVIKFRRLTKEEALLINPDLTLDQEEYTIAEIFNDKNSDISKKGRKKGIGFGR